ncbi:hypothetical protein ACFX13_023433 [Malus domestica]
MEVKSRPGSALNLNLLLLILTLTLTLLIVLCVVDVVRHQSELTQRRRLYQWAHRPTRLCTLCTRSSRSSSMIGFRALAVEDSGTIRTEI